LVALVFAIESPVLATGYYFHLVNPNFAYEKDGSTKVSKDAPSDLVQVITGSLSVPTSTGGVKSGQVIVYSGQIGDGNVGNGEFEYLYGLGDSQNVFLRIWPEGVGQGKYYGQSSQLKTTAAGQTANETPVSSITCRWKLSSPPGVNCSVSNFANSYSSSNQKYLPSFSVSPTNTGSQNGIKYVTDSTDSSRVNYTSISYEICKAPAGEPDWQGMVKTYDSGSVSESDPDNPFYSMGSWYAVRATATNDIDTGLPGEVLVFQIPAGDGSGGPYDVPLAFNSGINTIAIPFATNMTIKLGGAGGSDLDVDGNGFVSVQELIEAIKSANIPVTVFGWYDENAQRHKGLSSVAFIGNTVDIEACEATTGDSKTDILGTQIMTNHPYQVSAGLGGNLILNGTSQ
jgi:hypothetical protein